MKVVDGAVGVGWCAPKALEPMEMLEEMEVVDSTEASVWGNMTVPVDPVKSPAS